MSSLWFVQSDSKEAAPYTFEQIAHMLVNGKVHEWDVVKERRSSVWRHVETVPGVCRLAQRIRAEMAELPANSQRTNAPKCEGDSFSKEASHFHVVGNDAVMTREMAVQGTSVPVNSIEPLRTSPAQSPSPSRTVASILQVLAATIIGVVGWLFWHEMQQSSRFPKPPNTQQAVQPLVLPLVGEVTELEATFLLADAIGLVSICIWLCNHRSRH